MWRNGNFGPANYESELALQVALEIGDYHENLAANYLQEIFTKENFVPNGERCWGSHFWQSLVGVNHIYLQFVKKSVANGVRTLFW